MNRTEQSALAVPACCGACAVSCACGNRDDGGTDPVFFLTTTLPGDGVGDVVTPGAALVGTDISRAKSAHMLPSFASTRNGSSIASDKAVFSLSAAF